MIQIIAIIVLLIFATVSMLNLISKNKKDLLNKMFINGDINKIIFEKYKNE